MIPTYKPKPCPHCGRIVPLNDFALDYHHKGFCKSDVPEAFTISTAEKIWWIFFLVVIILIALFGPSYVG
jgi:hypothetical protein